MTTQLTGSHNKSLPRPADYASYLEGRTLPVAPERPRWWQHLVVWIVAAAVGVVMAWYF
jgi:hypothetical protein